MWQGREGFWDNDPYFPCPEMAGKDVELWGFFKDRHLVFSDGVMKKCVANRDIKHLPGLSIEKVVEIGAIRGGGSSVAGGPPRGGPPGGRGGRGKHSGKGRGTARQLQQFRDQSTPEE
jgi:hypothetical protein